MTQSLKDLNIIKKNRINYWILKYFQQHVGEKFPAIILDVMKSKYRVIIKDCLFTAEIKREAGMEFSPGMNAVVRVQKSDPWENLLKLEFIR